MSSESREIRPFNAQSLAHLFDGACLKLDSLECRPNRTVHLDDANISHRTNARLELAPEAGLAEFKRTLVNGAADAGVSASELALLVTASTFYLKITDMVEHSLADLSVLPRVIDLAEARALQASTSGAVVHAYVVLSKTLPRQPLKPWRKGAWLARSEFKLSTRNQVSPFRWACLDDEARARFNLPSQTMRYVHMSDHEPLEPFGASDQPEFYVDERLLEELSARPNTWVSKALQEQFAIDFMTAVIVAASSKLAGESSNETFEELEESLTGRVIKMIAGARSSDAELDKLVRLIRNDSARLIALAENSNDLLKTQLANLRGED